LRPRKDDYIPAEVKEHLDNEKYKLKMIEIIEKNFLGELDLDSRLFEHL